MPASALRSEKILIGDRGKSAQPAYSMGWGGGGKELLGAGRRVVIPNLGRLRPAKRASQPPFGFIELPSSTKFIGSELGVPDGSSCCITSDAMLALCE